MRRMKIGLATRFKIIGVEVIGLGTFTLIVLGLSLRQAGSPSMLEEFSWDYSIIAAVLIMVGLELLSLIKHLPTKRQESPARLRSPPKN